MAVLLGSLIGVALLLKRYRDRLHTYFGARHGVSRAMIDIAPGARLMVVEIDGITVVCGLNKSGITALQVVQNVHIGSAT
jgi:hypothetical protein